MPKMVVLANLRLRQKVLCWGTLAVIVGGGSILTLEIYLEHLTAVPPATPQLAAEHLRSLVCLGAAYVMLPALGLAGMLSYLALRVLRTGQYPPPEMGVLRNTPLRTGRAAQKVALVCFLCAVLVVLGGIGLGAVMYWVLSASGQQSPPPLREASALFTLATRRVGSTTPFPVGRT